MVDNFLVKACGDAIVLNAIEREISWRDKRIQDLQRALAFWLPNAPAEDTPKAKRIGDDAQLLLGYPDMGEGNAEELGWVQLTRASNP